MPVQFGEVHMVLLVARLPRAEIARLAAANFEPRSAGQEMERHGALRVPASCSVSSARSKKSRTWRAQGVRARMAGARRMIGTGRWTKLVANRSPPPLHRDGSRHRDYSVFLPVLTDLTVSAAELSTLNGDASGGYAKIPVPNACFTGPVPQSGQSAVGQVRTSTLRLASALRE